jgi:hypothetical protein
MEGRVEGYVNPAQQQGADHYSRISLRHNIDQLASSSHILFPCRVSFQGIGFTALFLLPDQGDTQRTLANPGSDTGKYSAMPFEAIHLWLE